MECEYRYHYSTVVISYKNDELLMWTTDPSNALESVVHNQRLSTSFHKDEFQASSR